MAMRPHPLWLFILFPAVTMLLGWGLRGFIGGGPFGAMIPGCFVALCLCLLLGRSMPHAAVAALFGAIAIGYGGNMTYGITLGLAREVDTRGWGFLGVTIKGGVWGLLGGPVLAAGLLAHRYKRIDMIAAFGLAIVAFFVGIAFINEPRLLDFSTRNGESRGESWAGLLFAAIAFTGYLAVRYRDYRGWIPLQFMALGGLGGALGFGLGTLWLVYGPETKWIGWWKAMEFSFGLIFGAFLGLAAWLNRGVLGDEREGETASNRWAALAPVLALVAFEFLLLPLLFVTLRSGDGEPSAAAEALRPVIRIFGNYTVFGSLCILCAMRSVPAAWQIAITLTFFHTAFDVVGDKMGAEGWGWSWPAMLPFMLIPTLIVAVVTSVVSRQPNAVVKMFLFAVWSCYFSACVMTYFHIKPPKPGAPFADDALALIAAEPTHLTVHGIFTASALLATYFAVTRFPAEGGERRLLAK